MKKTLINKLLFKCVILNDENVIQYVGIWDVNGIMSDNNGKLHYKVREKQDAIDKINQLIENNILFEMVTDDNTQVIIVDNKYFRTDGDKNKKNDLLDLLSCDILYPVYFN